MRKTMLYLLLGFVISAGFLFVLGIPTAVIPNPFFRRMLPAGMPDYFILAATSLLIGAYISVSMYYYKMYYHRNYESKSYKGRRSAPAAGGSRDVAFTAGAIPAVLGFICPVCNALLVAVFGATSLIIYFEPVRHYFGFAGIAILSVLLYRRIKQKGQKDCCAVCKPIRKRKSELR